MRKLQIKVITSLAVMLILSVMNTNQYFFLILLIGMYSLFKAIDLYHEMKLI